MHEGHDDRTARPVRLQTENGSIEGELMTSPVVRTLDEVNVVARGFLPLRRPRGITGEWPEGDGALAVSKASVVFLQEVTEPSPRPGNRAEAARFHQAPILLRVGEFLVEGQVHVPAGGTALTRLNQDSHPFMALTGARVRGNGEVFSAPFLAVNRAHIVAAQEPDAFDLGEGLVAGAEERDLLPRS